MRTKSQLSTLPRHREGNTELTVAPEKEKLTNVISSLSLSSTQGAEITVNRMEGRWGRSTRWRENISSFPAASFHLQQVTIRGEKENLILNQVLSIICYMGLDSYIID